MSNIDNASQTNQSMILHLFIKVDINDNQIANTHLFWSLFLLFISPLLTSMTKEKKNFYLFSPLVNVPAIISISWDFCVQIGFYCLLLCHNGQGCEAY
jgi:hypothetical protein